MRVAGGALKYRLAALCGRGRMRTTPTSSSDVLLHMWHGTRRGPSEWTPVQQSLSGTLVVTVHIDVKQSDKNSLHYSGLFGATKMRSSSGAVLPWPWQLSMMPGLVPGFGIKGLSFFLARVSPLHGKLCFFCGNGGTSSRWPSSSLKKKRY